MAERTVNEWAQDVEDRTSRALSKVPESDRLPVMTAAFVFPHSTVPSTTVFLSDGPIVALQTLHKMMVTPSEEAAQNNPSLKGPIKKCSDIFNEDRGSYEWRPSERIRLLFMAAGKDYKNERLFARLGGGYEPAAAEVYQDTGRFQSSSDLLAKLSAQFGKDSVRESMKAHLDFTKIVGAETALVELYGLNKYPASRTQEWSLSFSIEAFMKIYAKDAHVYRGLEYKPQKKRALFGAPLF